MCFGRGRGEGAPGNGGRPVGKVIPGDSVTLHQKMNVLSVGGGQVAGARQRY